MNEPQGSFRMVDLVSIDFDKSFKFSIYLPMNMFCVYRITWKIMEPWKISGTTMLWSSCTLGLVILFQVYKNPLS